jgi:hypothetical protein
VLLTLLLVSLSNARARAREREYAREPVNRYQSKVALTPVLVTLVLRVRERESKHCSVNRSPFTCLLALKKGVRERQSSTRCSFTLGDCSIGNASASDSVYTGATQQRLRDYARKRVPMFTQASNRPMGKT